MITRVHLYLFSKLPEFVTRHVTIRDDGCWEWCGTINRNGYGRVYLGGKQPMAHIFVYKFLHGDYKNGLLLDHHCRTRNCCNPTHIQPVTARVNTRRGKAVLFKKRVDNA